MYKSTSKTDVPAFKEDVGINMTIESTSSATSSLNPNEGDKGLKRTLKARHLTVNKCNKTLIFLFVYVNCFVYL